MDGEDWLQTICFETIIMYAGLSLNRRQVVALSGRFHRTFSGLKGKQKTDVVIGLPVKKTEMEMRK